jgi:hypothetical protein
MATKFGNGADFQQTQLLNAAVQGLSGAPGSPVTGQIYFDTTLHQFGVWNGTSWSYMGSGGGTVTSASVASANGFAGTVATSTTTPAITITTTVTGLLKGNGTAISAATAGTDYLAPSGNGSALTGITNSQVSGSAPTASPTFTGTVTVPATVNPTDAASKAYVDAQSQGLSVKPSARAKTTGAETFTIASGSVTVIAGTTIDGVSPAVGDNILIDSAPAATGVGSAGSTQPGNGLYTVTNATTNLTVTRVAQLSGTNAPAGAFVFVEAGTLGAANGYVVTTPSTNAAFTYGTGTIAFTQFSGAGEITVSSPLSKTGNALSLLTVPVASGGTAQTTAAGARGTSGIGAATAPSGGGSGGVVSIAAAGIPTKVAATIGDGSTTAFTITHNLGTRDVHVAVYAAATPYNVVITDVAITTTNTITVTFSAAPTASQYQVVVIG